MISGRPYMKNLSIEKALINLQTAAGTQFDPQVVEGLFSVISKHPEMIDSMESEPETLKYLHEHIGDLALDNFFEKKLTVNYPASF